METTKAWICIDANASSTDSAVTSAWVLMASKHLESSLLHHAVTAVAFQRSRGMLRDDIKSHKNDFDVVADFHKKPDIERWLLDADLSITISILTNPKFVQRTGDFDRGPKLLLIQQVKLAW